MTAATKDKKDEKEPAEKKLTLDERISRIEAALGSGMNVDINQFESTDRTAERNEIIRKAQEKMVAIANQAAEDISDPLTVEERIARLEAYRATLG